MPTLLKKQKGFTLIELVIVIVILGILAAMILPRFSALQNRARTASVRALEGGLLSASAIAHAEAISAGVALTGTATITLEGQTINIVNGYPDSTGTGVGRAATISSGYTPTYGTTGTDVATFNLSPAVTNCTATYTPATATTPPVVTTTTTGC